MPTILVVEDELAVFRLYRDVLEAAHLTVRGAATAAAAIQVCEEITPDLLIVDSGLPDAKGLDLLQYLRRPGMPAILTSGALSPELISAAKRLGFEPVEKLIGPLRLLSLVQHLLGL